jgi:arylsulfatase A-like enzyme
MRWLASFLIFLPAAAFGAEPPNVLIVITDDQGFGDLGAHGNPIIKTPRLDAFAKQSVWLKNFYVCPVCSPTRSSILTGQYNYRTGIVDTYLGRSLMRSDVKTLPEYLTAAGYRTGLFGKWHLGDNYPLRPEDRGFQETLWCQGGGLAQPSDAPQVDPKTAYFNPVLKQNGKEVKTKGYCTDVFTDAAVKFITTESKKPFFAYVAFNAPHAPYQVPEELAKPYKQLDLTAAAFPKIGQPWATPKLNTDEIANAYGMIENIDTNFGRLMKVLDDAKLADNTLVIFMSDNGVGGTRWNAGLRNRKGTVYEGGIRVPCYVRWPTKICGKTTVTRPLAHIDITPTLLSACDVKTSDRFDGDDHHLEIGGADIWSGPRTLFFQWHRGDEPEKYRAFAVRGPQYKLVQANGTGQGKWEPKFELFDIKNEPFEEKDIAAAKPEEVAKLKKEYEAWFADVTKKGFAPPRIIVGSEKENPVRLSRQDWRGPKAGWEPRSEGYWEIEFAKEGRYKVTIRSRDEFEGWEYELSADPAGKEEKIAASGTLNADLKMTEVMLSASARKGRFEVRVEAKGKKRGPDYVELEYLGPIEKK